MNASVLVVDDEPVFRVLAEEALASEGFEVRTVETLKKARAEIDRATPDVVILDRRLPDGDGIDFMKAVRSDDSSPTVVIVVTAYGDVENAVEALKAGAWDYLTKPVQLTDLIVKLRKVLETRGLRDRLAIAKNSAAGSAMVDPKSAVMRDVMERLRSVSRSPLTPVFMYGPSGVGKQRAAELLHALTWSGIDPHAPFLEVNCAALPEDLVESELFGHEKGAFTDAKATRRGLIEMAAGGTRFREDLYHRLAVFVITIPALASRPEDIPDLALAFVRFFAERVKKRVVGLTPRALAALQGYGYPGNVRELRNITERAVILASGPEVTERDLILAQSGEPPPGGDAFFGVAASQDGGPPRLEAVERAYVARVLEHFGGRRVAAAQALGISYPTFLKRLRELGLE